MKRLLTTLLVLCLALALASGCAISNHYEPYEGKVVNKDTREPIVGAAVLAVYYTQSYGLAGSSLEYLDAQETVTDEKGEFLMPSMHALTFRPLQSFSDYPRFTIFKPGYGCYPEHKGVGPFFRPSGTLPPQKNTIIKLPKLQTYEEIRKNYDCYPSLSVPRNKYPTLFNLIQDEREDLGLSRIPLK